MSRPSKWMRPVSGTISPASWPMSVVLPAPFGPMMACNSPGATSRPTLSDATTPPKRLVRPSILSSASTTARPRQQAVDTATRVKHDKQHHRPKNELPVFLRGGDFLAGEDVRDEADQMRQRLLQHQKRDRADHRAEH